MLVPQLTGAMFLLIFQTGPFRSGESELETRLGQSVSPFAQPATPTISSLMATILSSDLAETALELLHFLAIRQS